MDCLTCKPKTFNKSSLISDLPISSVLVVIIEALNAISSDPSWQRWQCLIHNGTLKHLRLVQVVRHILINLQNAFK